MSVKTKATWQSMVLTSLMPITFSTYPWLSNCDEREDYGEERYVGIGLLDGRVVVVVYTEPDEETVRIISLRKALSHERKRYEQYLKNRLE
jgi:uncharacterized DUF497 family protein